MELPEDHAQDQQNPIDGNPAKPAIAVRTRPEYASPAHEQVTDAQAEGYDQERNVYAKRDDMVVDHSCEERRASQHLQKNLTADDADNVDLR